MSMIKNALDRLKVLREERFIGLHVEVAALFLIAALVLGNYLTNNFSKENYLYLRLSEDPFNDDLSYGGRTRLFSLLPVLLKFFGLFFKLELVVRYLPLIIGIISLILFYLILKRYVDFKVRFAAVLIFTFSSSFLELFGDINPLIFTILISLLTLFLLKYNWKFIFLLLLVPLFDVVSLFFVMPLIFIYSVAIKQFRLLYVLPFLFLILPVFVLLHGIPDILMLERNNFFYNAVSDFGGVYGISLFVWILSFFGLFKLWEKKYEHMWFYTAVIFFAAISVYYARAFLLLSFFSCILAGYGIYKLIEGKWESGLIKNIVVSVMIFGLMFSFISYFKLDNNIPDNMKEGLLFLEKFGDDKVVFSHFNKGILINSIAKKRNVMDDDFFYAPDINERYNDSLTLFYTRESDMAISIIKKYDVGYILVDEEMRKGLVWVEEEEGLLFLLKYSTKFKKIYSMNNVDIWKVNL